MVHGAVGALPAEHRRLIELLFYSGFNETEAGDILGISQPQVNRRKKAALLQLRTELKSSLTFYE
jgi:DNA-directed RNA polymerase specialized sigma subunit